MAKKRRRQSSSGFTLIEIMVSVAIFAIVTVITSGSFIVLANIYHKIQGNRAIIDNLNLAMDTMTLQIREGREFTFSECGLSGNPDICSGISFGEYEIQNENYTKTADVEYSLVAGALQQCVDPVDTGLGNICIPFTSDEIRVDKLIFNKIDDKPLLVQVVMEGIAKNKTGLETAFLLQTTLTQRNY